MDQVTEEIRRRADIIEVVGQYVALRPAGNDRWKACCPFHDEKTPSFYVSRDKGFYKCFGCGQSGDVFKFLQQVENLTFPEAKKQLADRYGVTLPRHGKELTPAQQAVYDERDRLMKITAAAAAFFREQFQGNKGLEARDYARRRGLSPSTLDKFGIGYAPDAWDALYHHLVNRYGFGPSDAAAAGLLIEKETDEGRNRYYDRYRHRLIFPIWDAQGRVIAFGGRALEGGDTGTPDAKYINSPEGPLFNKSRTLYGWHIARAEVGKRESVIVTEGYMDAIALHEAGFANTIATLGTALTTQHVAGLARLAPKVVYLCYDGDSAGMRAALRAAPLFATHDLQVRVVTLPAGDDPDTFIRKQGEIGFQNALRGARLLARYRVEMAIEGFDLSNVAERMEAMRAASHIIAEVDNDIEKDDYISWLTDRWGQAEGVTAPTRLQMIQAAVRREVGAAAKRRHTANPSHSGGLQRPQQAAMGQAAAEAENQDVNRTLTDAAGGYGGGVAKAERILLSSLLGNPSWRSRILTALPPQKWTQETHREIAAALRQFDWNEPVDSSLLMDTLSVEAGGLVGELMMNDEAQTPATEAVVQDCIERIEGHWARQIEREILELVQLKLERGERISEEERAAYHAALLATGRKQKPSSGDGG
jgi:DNA primase